MARTTVDIDALMSAIIRTSVSEDVDILVEVSPDTPLGDKSVILSATQGRPIRNGPWDLAWRFVVPFSVVARDRAVASDLSDEVFTAVHEFEHKSIPEVGSLVVVEDVSMPTRVATSAVPNNHTFTQYNGQFTVIVRPVGR